MKSGPLSDAAAFAAAHKINTRPLAEQTGQTPGATVDQVSA
jgi:hypothetical protein